jgi:hypothetical protein
MRATAHTPPTRFDADHPALPAKLRDRRIEVSAITRARTPDGERAVRIVGLSARTALLVAAEPLGWAGQCVELDVPTVGGRDLSVMAGIARSERCRDGHAVTVELVVADSVVRRQLNELLALLLAGEPDSDARQPRVVYDVVVAYGPTGARQAHLQEISLAGLSMRVAERIAHDVPLEVIIPTLRGGAPVPLRGRVTGQRLSAEGGYITALDLEPLDGTRRHALGALVADLMCR